jgi:hypothetical protein
MGWPVGVSVPVLWSTLNCTTVSEFWFAWPSDGLLGESPAERPERDQERETPLRPLMVFTLDVTSATGRVFGTTQFA